MGESNPAAIALIADISGHEPRFGKTPDGQQCLHIGDTVVVASSLGLWGDPTAWPLGDGSLTVRWGGQSVQLAKDAHGQWQADVLTSPLAGKARFVAYWED